MIKINTCKCQVVALKRDAELVPGGCGGTSDISWGEIVMRDSQESDASNQVAFQIKYLACLTASLTA